MTREKCVAVRANVREIEVAEHHRFQPAVAIVRECGADARFVFLVARAFGYPNLAQRQSETLRLSLQKNAAHAMHADAVEIARAGREEHVHTSGLADLMEREAAVLAAAPA